MKEIIDWLTGIEKSAFQVYEKAAALFSSDTEFSDLLRKLAWDEKLHYEAMLRAGSCLKDKKDYPSIITLDAASRATVERPFLECRQRIEEGRITKGELLNYMAVIEFSELNYVFLYVINALMERSDEFSFTANNIEEHKGRIEDFIKSHPETGDLLKKLLRFPKVFKDKILIVDDQGVTVNLLKAILSNEGTVDTANNGMEALRKVVSREFSAIITDMDMPVMNGMEFYSKAVETNPGIRERFIFFTGSADPERISFFRRNNLKYLIKPAPINDIRKTVKDVISKLSPPPPPTRKGPDNTAPF